MNELLFEEVWKGNHDQVVHLMQRGVDLNVVDKEVR